MSMATRRRTLYISKEVDATRKYDLLTFVWTQYDREHSYNTMSFNREAFGVTHNGRFKQSTVSKKGSWSTYTRFVFNTSDALTAFLLTYSDGVHHPKFERP
jgi:hypothetical protein